MLNIKFRKMIADRINLILYLSGKTKLELAKLLSVDVSTVSMWCNGHSDIRLLDYVNILTKIVLYGNLTDFQKDQLFKEWYNFENNYNLTASALGFSAEKLI